MIDASHVKVHPHTTGARGGNQDMSRAKRGSIQRYIWPCLYRIRYLVKNTFLVLKRWRSKATRYAKTSDGFIAAIQVRCIAVWTAILA
jgi:hypothetical protein